MITTDDLLFIRDELTVLITALRAETASHSDSDFLRGMLHGQRRAADMIEALLRDHFDEHERT